jgi:hypothetical protein
MSSDLKQTGLKKTVTIADTRTIQHVLVSYLPAVETYEYAIQLITKTVDTTYIEVYRVLSTQGKNGASLQIKKVSEVTVDDACLDSADSLPYDSPGNSMAFSFLVACSQKNSGEIFIYGAQEGQSLRKISSISKTTVAELPDDL